MPDKIYLYDGSYEGLLTCVFEAYRRHEMPVSIQPEYDAQMSFDCEYINIETDEKKADRVFAGACGKLGTGAVYDIYYTYLSDRKNKERYIFEYLRLGFDVGRSLRSRLTEECVRFVADAAKGVSSEAHKYKGLVRFSELSSGAMYSEIEPKNNVLELLAPHFARRLAPIPWIIFDAGRRMCCVYDTKEWYMRPTDHITAELSESEEKYRRMWREFYDTIEIKERHNEKCRMTCMPKRYWSRLTELNRPKESNSEPN